MYYPIMCIAVGLVATIVIVLLQPPEILTSNEYCRPTDYWNRGQSTIMRRFLALWLIWFVVLFQCDIGIGGALLIAMDGMLCVEMVYAILAGVNGAWIALLLLALPLGILVLFPI